MVFRKAQIVWVAVGIAMIGLGLGEANAQSVPIGGSRIATGSAHTCVLTSTAGVKCWGANAVGNGSDITRPQPTDVTGLASGVKAITAGSAHVCAHHCRWSEVLGPQ